MKGLGLRVALAIAVSLLTLELGLQLASAVAQRRFDGRALVPAAGDEIAVLCVGDSHTWGAGVDLGSAYPAQLQGALARSHPERAFRVMNFGVPGVNSSYVAKRLERQILELRPNLVIVWVGANNIWNELEAQEVDEDASRRLHRRLLHSKLYRLVTVLLHTQSNSLEEVERDLQKSARKEAYANWRREGQPDEPERREARLLADMRTMVETSAAFDTPILFVSYPQQPESPISKRIAEYAGVLGVDVIVTSQDRERALADGLPEDDLFVFSAGPHPTHALYGYIVESMLERAIVLLGLGS